MLSINTFKIPQLFNDTQGKTSLPLVMSFVIISSGVIGFILSGTVILFRKEPIAEILLIYQQVLIYSATVVIPAGVALLTAHTLRKDQAVNSIETINTPGPIKTETELKTASGTLKETVTESKPIIKSEGEI